ncbi:MAG: HepT-like ribonuclease domain-containing protein [Armatimonadota bacterium]
MKDDRLYLIHISECIGRVEDYVSGGRDEFLGSPLIQDAVIRNLQTMAESTQRLSEELKSGHAEIDWRRISGFRNVVVHDYLGVDIPYVWQIVEHELPVLKRTIEAMLDELQ